MVFRTFGSDLDVVQALGLPRLRLPSPSTLSLILVLAGLFYRSLFGSFLFLRCVYIYIWCMDKGPCNFPSNLSWFSSGQKSGRGQGLRSVFAWACIVPL